MVAVCVQLIPCPLFISDTFKKGLGFDHVIKAVILIFFTSLSSPIRRHWRPNFYEEILRCFWGNSFYTQYTNNNIERLKLWNETSFEKFVPDCVLLEQYLPIFQVLLAVQQWLQVTIKLEQTNKRTVNQSIQQEMNYQWYSRIRPQARDNATVEICHLVSLVSSQQTTMKHTPDVSFTHLSSISNSIWKYPNCMVHWLARFSLLPPHVCSGTTALLN